MSQQVTGLAGRQSQWCTVKAALILPRQPLPWFWERCSRISSLGNSPSSSPRPRREFQGEGFVRSSLPPALAPCGGHGDTEDKGTRGTRGSCGSRAHRGPGRRALPAPARSQPSPGPCCPCPSTAPRPSGATSGPRATRVPPLSPGWPGLGPGGLAGSSNLICLGPRATQRAFVRLKHLIWSRDLQPVPTAPSGPSMSSW